jgi:hypothetical protein
MPSDEYNTRSRQNNLESRDGPKKSAGKKAAETRKRRAAGKKAAAQRKHHVAGVKAAAKRKHGAAGNQRKRLESL